MDKYIYLDWNVFKYIKKPRSDRESLDLEAANIILNISSKYTFPYSEGHLRDLSHKYSEEHKDLVLDDLRFVSKISKDFVLGVDNNDDFHLIKKDPCVFFEELQSQKAIYDPNKEIRINKDGLKKDLIDTQHPFYDQLNEKQNEYSIDSYEYFKKLLNDSKVYKQYRNYIPRMRESIQNNVSVNELIFLPEWIFLSPFLELCAEENNYENLLLRYEEVVRIWLLYRYKDPKKIPFGDVISTGYSLLDFHPLFKEDLNKKNGLSNIIRDSKHAFFAHKATYFISEDQATINKMTFLYKALKIKTKVIKMGELSRIFS